MSEAPLYQDMPAAVEEVLREATLHQYPPLIQPEVYNRSVSYERDTNVSLCFL